jgi:hypothetical protein
MCRAGHADSQCRNWIPFQIRNLEVSVITAQPSPVLLLIYETKFYRYPPRRELLVRDASGVPQGYPRTNLTIVSRMRRKSSLLVKPCFFYGYTLVLFPASHYFPRFISIPLEVSTNSVSSRRMTSSPLLFLQLCATVPACFLGGCRVCSLILQLIGYPLPTLRLPSRHP